MFVVCRCVVLLYVNWFASVCVCLFVCVRVCFGGRVFVLVLCWVAGLLLCCWFVVVLRCCLVVLLSCWVKVDVFVFVFCFFCLCVCVLLRCCAVAGVVGVLFCCLRV